jgi:hypothetical protein
MALNDCFAIVHFVSKKKTKITKIYKRRKNIKKNFPERKYKFNIFWKSLLVLLFVWFPERLQLIFKFIF